MLLQGPPPIYLKKDAADLVDWREENAPLVMSTGKERWRWSWRKGRWWCRSLQIVDPVILDYSKL